MSLSNPDTISLSLSSSTVATHNCSTITAPTAQHCSIRTGLDWSGILGKSCLSHVNFVTLEGREVNWLGPIVTEQTEITLLVSLIISFTVSPGTSEK